MMAPPDFVLTSSSLLLGRTTILESRNILLTQRSYRAYSIMATAMALRIWLYINIDIHLACFKCGNICGVIGSSINGRNPVDDGKNVNTPTEYFSTLSRCSKALSYS